MVFVCWTGNDLHLVTTSQFMTDWNQFMIHFCANTFYTNRTVNSKSKIKCCRTNRQHLYITFWRIHINFFGKKTGFEILQEINCCLYPGCRSLHVSAETIYQNGFHQLLPSLYFQCAANPFSAISFIRLVRICTSTHLPCGPITVVCNAS